jgi:hypothetical protein
MIPQFLTYFLGTGIIIRLLTPPLHFKNKTITHKIRKKTGINIHHLHIGIVIFTSCLLLLLIKDLNTPILLISSIGLSFMADEVCIYKTIDEKYFTKEGFKLSIISHIIIGIIIVFLLSWLY